LSILLLNVGLLGSFFTILLRSQFKPAFALMLMAGLALYGWEVVAILRARKRRTLDWGLRYFLTALGLLLPLAAMGLVLSWPALPLTAVTGQLENLYGFVALAGVISFAIIGMLYKIIPFLVWYRSYSRQIGSSKVPSLADLYSPQLQAAGYWSYVAGLSVTSVGILWSHALGVRCGATLLAGSLLLLAINLAKMLTHLFSPQLQPLKPQPTTGMPS
ncbi:MAG TPA: hypothetical protein VNZ22_04200, partial [Bacillota bacterium]|nr:hypothetical protein [Bacillota bacterium]